jgi:hypothetical protein
VILRARYTHSFLHASFAGTANGTCGIDLRKNTTFTAISNKSRARAIPIFRSLAALAVSAAVAPAQQRQEKSK